MLKLLLHTLVEHASTPAVYNDDANMHDRGQCIIRVAHPLERADATLRVFVFPATYGEVDDSEEEVDDDEEENYSQDTNLKQELDQEYEASSLSDSIHMTNNMDAMTERAFLQPKEETKVL
jgi:hypothetical protein